MIPNAWFPAHKFQKRFFEQEKWGGNSYKNDVTRPPAGKWLAKMTLFFVGSAGRETVTHSEYKWHETPWECVCMCLLSSRLRGDNALRLHPIGILLASFPCQRLSWLRCFAFLSRGEWGDSSTVMLHTSVTSIIPWYTFQNIEARLWIMHESWLNLQEMVQGVLFARYLLQYALLEQSGTAEKFQTKCMKSPYYLWIPSVVAKMSKLRGIYCDVMRVLLSRETTRC